MRSIALAPNEQVAKRTVVAVHNKGSYLKRQLIRLFSRKQHKKSSANIDEQPLQLLCPGRVFYLMSEGDDRITDVNSSSWRLRQGKAYVQAGMGLGLVLMHSLMCGILYRVTQNSLSILDVNDQWLVICGVFGKLPLSIQAAWQLRWPGGGRGDWSADLRT
jgi:hypothetical protein